LQDIIRDQTQDKKKEEKKVSDYSYWQPVSTRPLAEFRYDLKKRKKGGKGRGGAIPASYATHFL